MIKNVPHSEDEIAEANAKVVEALYGLAQVYNNKLNILDSAVAVYTRLVARYPDSEFALNLVMRSTKSIKTLVRRT